MANEQSTNNVCPKGLLKLIMVNTINQLSGPSYARFADIVLAASGLAFADGKLAPAHAPADAPTTTTATTGRGQAGKVEPRTFKVV